MKNERTQLKIVRLIEPALCLSCKHAAIATVEMANGTSRRMLHCKRLDCDNWQSEETDDIPSNIHDDG